MKEHCSAHGNAPVGTDLRTLLTCPCARRFEKRLKVLCVRALKRVFVMCDVDGDSALNDAELNAFQVSWLLVCVAGRG